MHLHLSRSMATSTTSPKEHESTPTPASGPAKDPICGMVVDRSTALIIERGGRVYYFCSTNCLRTFESPETELKAMRTRVTIALAGVLMLAILRAAAFIVLATGATIVTWAPIPVLPWMTRRKLLRQHDQLSGHRRLMLATDDSMDARLVGNERDLRRLSALHSEGLTEGGNRRGVRSAVDADELK